MPEAFPTFYLGKLVRDDIPVSHEREGGFVYTTEIEEGFGRFGTLVVKAKQEAIELFANPKDPGEAADAIEALLGLGLMYGFDRQFLLDYVAGKPMMKDDGDWLFPQAEDNLRGLFGVFVDRLTEDPMDIEAYSIPITIAFQEAGLYGGQRPSSVFEQIDLKYLSLGGFERGVYAHTATVPVGSSLHNYYSQDPARFPVVEA